MLTPVVPALPARALPARRSALTCCALLLAAAAAGLAAGPRLALPHAAAGSAAAFAGGAAAGVQRWRAADGRAPRVACGVRMSKRGWIKDLWEKSDEELHAAITEAREKIMNHRFDVWRKRDPSPEGRHKYQHRIAVAKTILKQREIDENAKAAAKAAKEEQEPGPVLSDLITKEEQVNAFQEWYEREGKSHDKKFGASRVPSSKIHYSPESKEWAEANIAAEALNKGQGKQPRQWVCLTGSTGLSAAFAASALFAAATGSGHRVR